MNAEQGVRDVERGARSAESGVDPGTLSVPSSAFRIPRSYRAVVVGASAGGLRALLRLLPRLPADYTLPVIVVQHVHASEEGDLAGCFDRQTALSVAEARDKGGIRSGHVYFAPADYHLLVERDETFALCAGEKVNWSRPSIDVLFESAAYVWGERLVGVVLSGSNHDGARGMCMIKESGGVTIVQDPSTAEHPVMPQAAINATKVDHVLSPESIAELLVEIATRNPERGTGEDEDEHERELI